MRNLIKKQLLALCALASTLSANWVCESPGLEIGADFIWWKPCVDQLEYAGTLTETLIISPSQEIFDGNVNSLSLDWEPGFRIYLKKENIFCNLDIKASYTYIKLDSKEAISTIGTDAIIITPFINPIVMDNAGIGDTITGTFKAAAVQYNAKYHYWDAQVGYPMYWSCHRFRPHAGFAGVIYDQTLNGAFADPLAELNGDFAATRWNSSAWGAGFGVGAEYEYYFCNGLALFSQADGVLTAGQYDSLFQQATLNGANGAATAYQLKRPSNGCHFFPGYHFALGLSYQSYPWGKDFKVRVGYELLSWNNLPNQPVFSADTKEGSQFNSSSVNKRTVGFHGLLAGASFSF